MQKVRYGGYDLQVVLEVWSWHTPGRKTALTVKCGDLEGLQTSVHSFVRSI